LGVIERFGRKVMPCREPGLHYRLPWPVERLTRVPKRVRVVEVGFRSNPARPDREPAAYEWNTQHRSGRFERKPDESLMLTGDQNMIELTATVHYRLRKPEDFLFRQMDGEATVRAAAESVLQTASTAAPLETLLTTGRGEFELRARAELERRLEDYSAGVEILQVRLLDVHPSVEVVDAFRDVAGASEEKSRLINEAEGYYNEQIALARGNAEARRESAAGYTEGKKNRAQGDASRFTLAEEAARPGVAITETRLYLETLEQVLPGRKKFIVDSSKARRHLVLLEDGVEFGAAGTALATPDLRPGGKGID
jgi:HflK protein